MTANKETNSKTTARKTTKKKAHAKKKSRKKNSVKKTLNFKETEHARNYCQIAFDYAQEAKADKKRKKFCKWVQLAAIRFLEDLKEQKKKSCEFVFDPWHGNDICDFVEKFPHVEGEWSTETIELEPAQIFILVNVFGFRKKSNLDLRRFSTVYIEMARKGAKSTLTAAVVNYCLTCEGENGPQIIIGATTGAQADKVFKPAKTMAERSPDYREAFGVEVWAKSITCDDNGGFIQTINSKSSTQDGWNPHVGVLDELHAHKDRGLYDVIKSAFGARKNPLFWVITTAGYIIDGVCYEQHQAVKKILQNIYKADHYFGIIFTLDDEDIENEREFDPSVWVKANPMLGITPTLESMETSAIDAKNSPESQVEFRTKRLNIWTTARNPWLNFQRWKKCGGPVDLDQLENVLCCGGLDLASRNDFCAFVLTWIFEDRLKIWGRYYVPEAIVIPRTEKGSVPYQTWVNQGFLIATPGDTTDYSFIQKDIEESLNRFQIKEIGFDPWNANHLVTNLTSQGAPMVEFRQGPASYNPPMKEFERRVTARTIDHGDNPVLNWMASNVVARKDVNDNMAPDRKNSTDKIDGIAGGLMGLGRLMVHQPQKSIYETRGVRTV